MGMLRITQNSAPQGAKSYYSTADYYGEGQESVGRWRGKAAERLGLAGEVRQDSWDALCDNRDPRTGDPLTPRTKSERRVGYDFNFHAPKSVSLLYGLTGDDRIRDVFREAVDATMQDIEAEMQTRVRGKGQNADRTTGNLVWGEFLHFTARPVDGLPDPHLHAHCFTFNATWDSAEQRWKAGQFAGLKRDAPYFESLFHARLAHGLEQLGIATERTAKGWEIADIPGSALRKFSRRTALIEAEARAKGITDPDQKGALGATTREKKSSELTLPELRRQWAERLTADESSAIEAVAGRSGGAPGAADDRAADAVVESALAHCFERSSVAPERTVLTYALKRAVGRAAPESVRAKLDSADLIRAEHQGQRVLTTDVVLAEERRMLDFARRGRGACAPLKGEPHQFDRDWLNAGQRRAVEHVLQSRDRVILVRGAAGVGKTSMMQEAVAAIEGQGRRVLPLAPSADASRGVLRQEGFQAADTVARFLLDPNLQTEARGQVVWIDEAGLLGTPTLARVFDIAERLDARVVLAGDRRQHASVERGAALRLLETQAGLMPAEIKEIQRQKGAYKQAVEALSEGHTAKGFQQLDALGWVREVDDGNRYRVLAEDYVTATKAGETALVVSPTHREGEWITAEIRDALRKRGQLGAKEKTLPTLEPIDLTESQRRDPASYVAGDVLMFHQNAKGFRRGQRLTVGSEPLPLEHADKFQVFQPGMLPVSAGERVRITRNGATADGRHRLNNGALYKVRRVGLNGELTLDNGWVVPAGYGHFKHGYVVTSHASQGKTVDRVLIGQSSASFRASSREQFYVSVSRGRKQATIYTDDKGILREAIEQSEPRLAAVELVQENERRVRARTQARLRELQPARPERTIPMPRQRESISTEERRAYER